MAERADLLPRGPLPALALVGLAGSVLAVRRRRVDAGPSGAAPLGRVVTIERPPEEVYAFWRDLAGLPRVLPHLHRVDVLDERRSHWVASAPWGRVEWDAEIVDEQPGRRLAWRSVGHAAVPNDGQVTVEPAPGGRGTELRVALSYRARGGPLGRAVARLAGEEPDQQVRDALRRSKQLLECGQVVTADERVSGRGPLQRRITTAVRRQLSAGGRP